MAIKPVPPVTFGQYGNTGTINPAEFSRTGSPYTDVNLFPVVLNQAMNNSSYDILFGDDESRDTSVFGKSGFSGYTSNTDPLFGGLTGTNMPSDIGGQNTFYTGVNPQMEMIARSNLIGKTVVAVHPVTKQNVSGAVESVQVNNGILLFTINASGTKINVPPENLISVTQ